MKNEYDEKLEQNLIEMVKQKKHTKQDNGVAKGYSVIYYIYYYIAWWKVRAITSSCLSRVSLLKFTA